ncbi:uncharacterized protein LOC119363961 isoform X2 [Triticum dicoccoides]|uniref:uncharacterized protein LOC119363961 isoform X2 n=1 Tax=Triticum dicoccoides TaxID=85692 RepID=UPI00188E4370|nr:uncharacterized protein LOC119363961 isoform X2 [Triticum dicoccoides]XP_044324069.1 uncharacterized protein LOC123045182 isoform X2 [Triticum aestivum]
MASPSHDAGSSGRRWSSSTGSLPTSSPASPPLPSDELSCIPSPHVSCPERGRGSRCSLIGGVVWCVRLAAWRERACSSFTHLQCGLPGSTTTSCSSPAKDSDQQKILHRPAWDACSAERKNIKKEKQKSVLCSWAISVVLLMQFDSSQKQSTTPASCLREVLFCCKFWMSIFRAVPTQMRFRRGPLIFCLQYSVVKLYSSSPFILTTYSDACSVVWIFCIKIIGTHLIAAKHGDVQARTCSFNHVDMQGKMVFSVFDNFMYKIYMDSLKIVYQRSSF